MTQDDSYLYTIRPDHGYLRCGMTGDGRQVLMGLYCPNLVAIFFNTAGDYLGHEDRRLEFLQRSNVIVDGLPIEGPVAHLNIHDGRIDPRLQTRQDELAFRDLMVRVEKFSVPILGIEDEPGHFVEILEVPDSSEGEEADVRGSIADRYRHGSSVLFWGDDYCLDDEGEVISS